MKNILFSLLLLTFLSGLTHAQDNTRIFLDGIPSQFTAIDTQQDSDGNTYVLGSDAGNAVIVKYDEAGLTNAGDNIVINGFNPVAFAVGDNDLIYVASSTLITYRGINDKEGVVGPVRFSPAGWTFKDMVYSSVNKRLMTVIDSPSWPLAGMSFVIEDGSGGDILNFEDYQIFAVSSSGPRSTGSNPTTVTTDDSGNYYFAGIASNTTPAPTASSPYFYGVNIDPDDTLSDNKLTPDRPFIITMNSDYTEYRARTMNDYSSTFGISYSNGWLYLIGREFGPLGLSGAVKLTRFSPDLTANKSIKMLANTYFSLTGTNSNGKGRLFSVDADALDNVYVSGFAFDGTVEFVDDNGDSYRTISSTEEAPYVLKVNSDFEYEWVITPAKAPFTPLRNSLHVSYDDKNSRLWMAGTYNGIPMSMQDGPDADSKRTLSGEDLNQGFIAVFEPDGKFTRVVDLTIASDVVLASLQINGARLSEIVDFPIDPDLFKSYSIELIVDSEIELKVPRNVYLRGDEETDSLTGSNPSIVDNADTRFTFLNFSVNSVVEDSNATVYTFAIAEQTDVKLEWLIEYALNVVSDFTDTESKARNPDGSSYIPALDSDASGNPSPAVGKQWVEKDTPVVLQIDGAVRDLAIKPGLAVRYVPYAFNIAGALTPTPSKIEFPSIEPRQQVDEFTMTQPVTVEYIWKLQYGVDIKSSKQSANPLVLVEYLENLDGSVTSEQYSQGDGVYWYDDSATVRIAAPKEIQFSDGPQGLSGWLNGDGYIFSPAEDEFNPSLTNPFTSEQINDGFKIFSYNSGDGAVDYIGREVVLERPARVVWSFGDLVIYKTVGVGEFVQFTPDEISKFSLAANQLPTLANDPNATPSSDTPTSSDFIWDDTAKRFFPLRPLVFDLLWPATNGNQVKVEVTSLWSITNYNHIADTPGVSLVPNPPSTEPDDLIFQEVAYAEADGSVDDDNLFTASQPGRTVLEFNRITASGRGGASESVVELKVVQTKRWNTGLGATKPAIVGRKITSDLDLAELGTGYLFFDQARFNPFVYDRSLFSGEILREEGTRPGPIIPVNENPNASSETNDEFVVVWYDDPTLNDYMLWPYAAERYLPRWPRNPAEGLNRILQSSGFGSESVAADGSEQVVVPSLTVDGTVFPEATTFDPARVEQVQIYNQPDPLVAGYNPNEEHALMAPSLRFASVAPRPLAAYALRENDLNVTSRDSNYTSDPYVLVQYLDKADNEFKMSVFTVARADTTNYPNGFSQEMVAGEPVIPFYPLGPVSGATLSPSNYAKEGDPNKLVYWTDHKDTSWAVSGDGAFSAYFYYPLLVDFWWPDDSKSVGDFVAWLPNTDAARDLESFDIDYTLPTETPEAQGVAYTTVWPTTVPVMKVGETLTFAGGEYAQDNPGEPGLPGVLAWAAGEVIYDDLNPDMREGDGIDQDGNDFDKYTARMISALEQRLVSLPVARFPEVLLPATGRTEVDGTIYRFRDLSSSLKKRIFYDPLTGQLGIKGFVNDKDIGDETLTAAPPQVYVLEPNILTEAEYEELKGISEDSPFTDVADNGDWTSAVDALYKLSRNPNGLSDERIEAGGGYTAGLQVQSISNPNGEDVVEASAAEAYQALGPGLALVANPGFLDPNDETLPDVSYVTLAENNDPSLGGSPVVLHVIKIDRRERYRGAVKVLLSDNVFDENIILRHTGDFGAQADDLVFDWWYRVEDGTAALPPDQIPAGTPNPWKLFPDPSGDGGQAFYQLKLKGNPSAPELLLADSLWFVRYRHKDETPNNPVTWDADPEIPFEWAGAGNSTPNDLDGDGVPDYQAQLAQGWVKRVLDAVNPYEARIRDFNGDNPATYSSMIQQFGQRYEGPVALNPDKNVIENVGLIQLYGTVLNRARSLSIDLSTPVSTPGITNALLLASTRLADFYMLLGNEAYADAKNPTIGHGSNSVDYGNLAPTVFTFQNQLSSKIEEELGLLRGVYDFKARPVYNRLFWNFTKGEGEAAYATNYNLSDINEDGFINEDDALILYPQGHGDAWGHYLTALRGQYELLNNPFFNWVSRSELYSLQDIVIEVDFLDERKFAQVAAAKAKAGSEIVALTYRDNYVADPESQWQGYLDTQPQRAWGVEGWARRAGQGAYFDWVTANALIPSEHPNSSFTGIQKVDRTTVKDIAVVSANMNAVQRTFEDANSGFNPLGISGNTVPFDIDPSLLDGGSGATHFEQIYQRAVDALNNAVAVYDYANDLNNQVRGIANDEIDFRRAVFEEDLAYRGELIEIFGTPYAGTIGSGRAYPAGYSGPDTSLYMYVDPQVRTISADTVPGLTADYRDDLGSTPASYLNTEFRATFSSSTQSGSPSNWVSEFNDVNYIVTDENGIEFDADGARVPLTNVDLPIKSSGYTFAAPEEWGDRASPGLLQLKIAEMIQQEANLAQAMADWDNYQGEVILQLRLIAAQVDMDKEIRGLLAGQIATNTILGTASLVASTLGETFEDAGDVAGDLGDDIQNFVPTALPTGGFSISPGDALSAVRGAATTGATAAKAILLAARVTANTVANTADLGRELADLGFDFAIDKQERNFELKSALVELENMIGDDAILRINVFREQEALRALSEEYRALLQRGARLIDEREAYNKRVAELVQRNRYQDMTFRVARNAALQRYEEAFDITARYTYLAAKAYDYETNLNPNAAGSAQGILTDIVGERSLGYIDPVSGVPLIGKGGLSEQLAMLKANFDVLKGQLGINNPQTESGRFSLRREMFRIAPSSEASPASDQAWRDELQAAKVDNLWDLPEFRRYCRPFAAYDPANPEPGLVIEFSSEVTSRKNFFGLNLAGGDNAYDPTNYSTKILSVGAWFEGYLSSDFATDLSETPRIYLVPVGTDVMAYPSDTDLGVRMWDVLDQKIPVPFPILQSNLDDGSWRPLDTLGGTEGDIRKFSSFRAYHDSGYFDETEMSYDTRLVGRSVWNTRWLLIIPGATLSADAETGLQTFIDNVSDIKLFFQTYGFSGN
ncbi:hypothetical protein DDZ13_03905 [Coraliomargarita sinensis]|uniref:Uncharacterized protein n=1 Tax=Coraliomargarita sinensis TaxID=2174842 RepID=A0A317ZHR1_9BACT|nr:hypothetical protein [Coraliomargarita sinensis]PXA05115.1 hypothetical protein DDZ13_03905 [Coraliomargarita sinensis]